MRRTAANANGEIGSGDLPSALRGRRAGNGWRAGRLRSKAATFVVLAAARSAAKAAKPSISFGSGNTGGRAAAELLKARLGFDMLHVPYRGSPQALTDLIGGRIDVFFPDPASALGLLGEGKFKVFGVTGPKRIKTLPEVPTLTELGVPDFNIVAWVAAFAPAGTPAAVIERLNGAINTLLREADTLAFVDRIGSDIMATTPAGLAAFVDEDRARWAELVEVAKIEKK